ncbi:MULTISPECIES: molecular chaperone [unclassified Burkholderia]|uniref:fimbrial biogenesis chaperone n=1 Tax=unclassified Burkholderia TaxID=2613784 RepID=UPI002ABD89D4|nr:MULTISPECIES: molecular chaperone [unclassified Burkholderia]
MTIIVRTAAKATAFTRRGGRCRRFSAALLTCMAFGQAHAQTAAGLFVSATRLVFSSGARDASLQIYNENPDPVVVQTWVDAGDIEADPATIDVPFVVLPPIMRLQANEARALRIVYSQQPLPADRESVFWLNAQMIPPRPAGDAKPNVMDVSVRIRQKIFFRPRQLTGGSQAWMASLHCRVAGREDAGMRVRCENPSPYFATLDSLTLQELDGQYFAPGGMLEPFGSGVFRLDRRRVPVASDPTPEPGRLHATVIDDDGRLEVLVMGSDNGARNR